VRRRLSELVRVQEVLAFSDDGFHKREILGFMFYDVNERFHLWQWMSEGNKENKAF
jgi:hypothetical protein